MGAERALPLVVGALAISSGLALLTFDILFSISFRRDSTNSSVRIVAIMASGLEAVTVTLLVLLVGRQVRYRNGSHIQDFGHGKKYTYLLAGLAGALGILGAGVSAIMFGLARRGVHSPQRILGSSTTSIVGGGFVAWAIALVSQAGLVFCLTVMERRDFQQQTQSFRTDVERNEGTVVEDVELPSTPKNKQGISYPEKTMSSSKATSSSSSGRSRSDTMNSIRSSLSQAIRPASSKTKLISNKSRGTSTESHREIAQTDEGFDSWDTSTVDAQSRHAVESVSPTPPRFLETIPASPTTSRSPSPGFPLDLEPPPRIRRRSRSLVGSGSYQEFPRNSGATSPDSPSLKHESHIHPLFRTDSPTPPPSATPGTNVNAAPGAGLLISDRESIRSLSRMRSGSLPTSPLVHSASLDSIRFAIEREEREREWARLDLGGERTLTPPIPDFVLNGTPRSSMMGYTKRKTSARGLNIQAGERNEI